MLKKWKRLSKKPWNSVHLAKLHKGQGWRYPLCELLLGVGAELQQPHEHGRHVHVGLPDGEAAADEVDGGPADGAVRREPRAGRLQQQEGQRLAWHGVGEMETFY